MTGSRILFRADSSTDIGSGHVMRCLTLATALRNRGAFCRFVCRDLNGNISTKIRAAGFDLDLLPAPAGVFTAAVEDPKHAAWAGVSWHTDAHETAAVMTQAPVDWIVLDHYGFDARWTQGLGVLNARKMVIDDLADRPLDADVVLDQGIERVPSDYGDLVEARCLVLAGPRFALTKPEFAARRDEALRRREGSARDRLLISLGGYDTEDFTGSILRLIAQAPQQRFAHIDVVVGLAAPHRDRLAEVCRAMPVSTTLHVDTPEMPSLMVAADIAIGGAGMTAIERCVLGLPAAIVIQAENQISQAQNLTKRGAAAIYDVRAANSALELEALFSRIQSPEVYVQMSAAASTICDGQGLARVVTQIDGIQRAGG